MQMYRKDKIFQVAINIFMVIVTIVTVLPLILLFVASFTDNTYITLHGYSFFPKEFSLEAYGYIWNERLQIFHAYFITILVTAVGTAVGLGISILYAYALSRPQFPGKKFFSIFILITMLFNGGLVPTYIMYTRYLNIKDTIFGLLIPTLLMNAFNVILIRSYFQNNVSNALIEAAQIDGASQFLILRKIVVPLSKPIIATMTMFIGVAYWNDWMNGLYYITDPKLYSIQQILNNMIKNIEYLSKNASAAMKSTSLAGTLPSATVRMAIAVIGILPILIIFPFIQKHFVKGISLGAVKG